MNDKQKLALKELADVMEKHGIAIAAFNFEGCSMEVREVEVMCTDDGGGR